MSAPADSFPQPHRRLTATAAGLTLLTVALWGGNPVATRFSVDALPPVTVSGLRFLMATGVMLVWCVVEGVSFRVTRPQIVPILVAGTMLFLQIATFTLGAAWTSSSHTSLLVNTFVFWVVGIEHFVTRTHRLTPTSSAGLLLAAAGTVALLWDAPGNTAQADPPSLAGDALMLVSALLLGLKFIYTKRALTVIGPTELIFWHDIVAVVQFGVVACLLERPDFAHVGWASWLGLMYQGLLVGGVCFALQAHLLKHHTASQIAVFSFLTPVFGIVLGMLFRGDHLSSGLVLSGLTVAAGIYLVNWSIGEMRRLFVRSPRPRFGGEGQFCSARGRRKGTSISSGPRRGRIE